MLLQDKMSDARQTQQTQDPSQRRSEHDIMFEVLTSGCGHLTRIWPTIKKSVREQAQAVPL